MCGTSCPRLCTPLRLWGRRTASSVSLSSATSAHRLTGATVAPPPQPRDNLLPGVAGCMVTGRPRVSISAREPRYGQIEYTSICSASTHQNTWSRQRQPPRVVQSCDTFSRPGRSWSTPRVVTMYVKGGGADLDASGQWFGSIFRNRFQERTASVT